LRGLGTRSTMHWALLVSLGLHAAALTVRVVNPEGFNRLFEDTPLEVILVNARSADKPVRAQAIAQASLAGGGEADKGRATSPLPPTTQMEMGDAPADAHRKIDKLQEQQQQLLLLLLHLLDPAPCVVGCVAHLHLRGRRQRRRGTALCRLAAAGQRGLGDGLCAHRFLGRARIHQDHLERRVLEHAVEAFGVDHAHRQHRGMHSQ